MARRKTHHPKSNESASSGRSATAGGTVTSKVTSNSNNSHSNNKTCALSNESRTSVKRNGIKVQSEEEEEDESEEAADDDEVDGNENGDAAAAARSDNDDEDAEDDEDGGGVDDGAKSEEFVRSNNTNSNNKRKRIRRKRKKRLGRPPQNLSMDDVSMVNVSNGNGGGLGSRSLTNGHQTFTCPSCNLAVNSASEFTRHIRQHNTIDTTASSTHSCSLCGKVLSSASSLDRHMLVHSGERPFKCSRCDMAFTTNGNMHRHMRTHHDVGYKSSSPSLNNSVHSNNLSDEEYNSSSRKSRGTPVKRKLHITSDGAPVKRASSVAGVGDVAEGRNLWTKRSRSSVSEIDYDEGGDEESEEIEKYDEMSVDNLSEDPTLQCPLCNKGFLCKSGLRRHLEGHPDTDLRCKECDEAFDNWQGLLKHLQVIHLKGAESSTVLLGSDDVNPIVLSNNNNNNKAVDMGFHDLTFVDFSTAKFALIAKSACERHVRRPSSAYHVFQCQHCWKAFPCGSSLQMHLKTAHTLNNVKSKSTPPPSATPQQHSVQLSATTTCLKCQAAFPTYRQLETHSLRHQTTEHCATPYSKIRETGGKLNKLHQKQQIADPPPADRVPDLEVKIDKESFLALLELQSRKNGEDFEQEDDDELSKIQIKRNVNNNNKVSKVSDIQSNDFADIQSIIAVASSTTMNIIPTMMMMGSSPACTRPSSTLSSDLPASPRLADSVTASPELPSPNQNQSSTTETTSDVCKDKIDISDKIAVDDDDHEIVKETSADVEPEPEVDHIVSSNNDNSLSKSPMVVVDLSSSASWTTPSAPPAAAVEKIFRNIPPSVPSVSPVINFSDGRFRDHHHPSHFPQEESNSIRSLIDLTNNTLFDPPQEQPLDLVLQPMDLTFSNSKKLSSSVNDSSSSTTSSSTASSFSALPIDLSASTRQRTALINHRVSPLMTSTPAAAAIRRFPPLVSPLPTQPIATSQLPQQLQQQQFETTASPFPNMFSSNVLSSESYATPTSNLSQSPRFHQDGVRRPIAVQPAPPQPPPSTTQQHQHSMIQNVGDSIVPLTLVRHATSHHVTHMANSLRSAVVKQVSGSSGSVSSASGFLLKKQKQRRYRTERPFKCAYCAAGFTLRSNMERHIKQQHPEFWASKSRGRKERPIAPHPLGPPPVSLSPSLSVASPSLPQSRLIHPVAVPNVAFPSIPPPQNVTEYNPVLAAAANNALANSRPPLNLDRSPSPLRLTLASSLNKAAGTISEEVKQAISNQIKQRQNIEIGNLNNSSISSLNSAVNLVGNMKLPLVTEGEVSGDVGGGNGVPNILTGETTSGGRLLGSGAVRHLWRPAPQMDTSCKSVVEDVDECGADLASVSKLLDTANQQSIQEMFRKRRSREDDDEEDDENDDDSTNNDVGGGHKADESEEDQPLASLKSKDQSGDSHAKTPERSKDGRKSAYGNAPNRVACPYCNRQFPWTSSLRRHVLTHTGQKPYKCPKCPLWFTTKSNCDRHLSRKHGGSGGGVSTVDVVENSEGLSSSSSIANSTLNSNLTANSADCTARNAPDRPYRCHLCLSSTFSTPGNLQKHMMTKHPNQLTVNTSTIGGSVVRVRQHDSDSSSVANKLQQNEYGLSTEMSTTSPTPGDRSSNTGGESSSGSERCWGAESEESGEDQTISEGGQQGEALFVCFVCLKSFADRGHCLEHLKEKHPDDHKFFENNDNGQMMASDLSASSALHEEVKCSSESESVDRDRSSPEVEDN